MKNTAGEKVRDIIRKEFDSRMEMAVATYIIDKGWEHVKQITEEQIVEVKGNSFMTDRFVQALVRCAVKICNECNQIEEFLPFIVNYLYVPNAQMFELNFEKDDVSTYQWSQILRKSGLDMDEDEDDIDMIVLNANVIETVKF